MSGCSRCAVPALAGSGMGGPVWRGRGPAPAARAAPDASVCQPGTLTAPARASQPAPPTLHPTPCRLVTIGKDGAQRRLIKPEEQPVFWDELPAPQGMVV